jgi:hypothetical protein
MFMKACFTLRMKVRSEGANLEVADNPFGIANWKSQVANLKSEICDLKFLALARTRPSAAAESFVSERHFRRNPGSPPWATGLLVVKQVQPMAYPYRDEFSHQLVFACQCGAW